MQLSCEHSIFQIHVSSESVIEAKKTWYIIMNNIQRMHLNYIYNQIKINYMFQLEPAIFRVSIYRIPKTDLQ
jgi:hypothetical protein